MRWLLPSRAAGRFPCPLAPQYWGEFYRELGATKKREPLLPLLWLCVSAPSAPDHADTASTLHSSLWSIAPTSLCRGRTLYRKHWLSMNDLWGATFETDANAIWPPLSLQKKQHEELLLGSAVEEQELGLDITPKRHSLQIRSVYQNIERTQKLKDVFNVLSH